MIALILATEQDLVQLELDFVKILGKTGHVNIIVNLLCVYCASCDEKVKNFHFDSFSLNKLVLHGF